MISIILGIIISIIIGGWGCLVVGGREYLPSSSLFWPGEPDMHLSDGSPAAHAPQVPPEFFLPGAGLKIVLKGPNPI